MQKITLTAIGLLLVSLIANADEHPDFAQDGRPFIQKFCIGCHSGAEPKAELSFDTFHDSPSLVRQRKIWENAVKMVIGGEMPPKDEPRPTVAEAEIFVAHVKSVFDDADRHAIPDPGRVTMRRLNRVEYRNTIRDLIGVTFDPTEDFPSDDIGHGFDNIGDVLTLSPMLMERYLAAAETIMHQAIVLNPPPVVQRQLASMYTEPASGDVATKLIEDGFRRVTSDGTDATEIGPLNTPYIWEDGDYIFRTRVYGKTEDGMPLKVAILVHGLDLADSSSEEELAAISGNVLKPAKILKIFELKANSRETAEILEISVPAIPGRHRMLVGQLKPLANAPPTKLFVEYLALDGPLDTRPKSHQQLLAREEANSLAQQTIEVLNRFLRRAFRRAITAEELQRSVLLVDQAIAAGESWESGIQLAMQAALCSPKFLFRAELDDLPDNQDIRKLDEFQLASRLSYFLWSTMPDDTLLDLAESDQLTANLESQVQRMLTNPKASSLVQNFALQWLQLKRIEFIAPDERMFPAFNAQLRAAMIQETQMFVESILLEDRSVLELIDANYTFLNQPLAQHYGIADTHGNMVGQPEQYPGGQPIQGDAFVRVSLTDKTRGGLLTQASVLTVTSNPTRTSPVKRGRWVLEQVLGSAPPGPPPNVPELPSSEADATTNSLRQRMENHRKNPSCANCHAKMDPIGFALENFNAVGGFRTKDGPFDIDSTGEFPDGTKFRGPADLKTLMLERKDEFTRCLTEKMLTYALGRGLEYYDRPVVEKIVKNLAAGNYKFSVLVIQIVQCEAFRERRGMTDVSAKRAPD